MSGTGYTAIADGGGTSDCHGHGTHIAGTVGGTTYGVAKNVTVHPVRVLDCTGSGSYLGRRGRDQLGDGEPRQARGRQHEPRRRRLELARHRGRQLRRSPASPTPSPPATAATDACNHSPARAPSALTVGATTSTDAQASYSNFGTCLDLYAPGSSVTSAYYTSDTATATMSGTSMASPHVAGAAALYLETNPTATPAVVAQAILSLASQGKVTAAGAGSPNLLLHSLFAGGSPADTTPAQTADYLSHQRGDGERERDDRGQCDRRSGVSSVEFWIDGVKKGSDSTSPYTYAWDTTLATNASHTLVSKAYDTWNNMGTSASVSVTVNNVAVPPPGLVTNGGFEGAPNPWAFSGHASWASGAAHGGSSFALLGNRNRANGSVSQSGTIPARRGHPHLLAERHLQRHQYHSDRRHLRRGDRGQHRLAPGQLQQPPEGNSRFATPRGASP